MFASPASFLHFVVLWAACHQVLASGPAAPGTAAGCWDSQYSYHTCCLGESNCFSGESFFSRATCCSGLQEAAAGWSRRAEKIHSIRSEEQSQQKYQSDGTGTERLTRPSWPGLQKCLEEAEAANANGKITNWEAVVMRSLQLQGACEDETCSRLLRNSFNRAVECLGSLADVEVVLDLFLGGGFSAGAAAMGLISKSKLGIPRSSLKPLERKYPTREIGASGSSFRPLEVFTFERDLSQVRMALRPKTGMIRLGPWPHPKICNITKPEKEGLEEQILNFQSLLLSTGSVNRATSETGSSSEFPSLWILMGRPYPRDSLKGYAWNALDVLCQHRAPLDLLVMDSEVPCEQEWLIIEAVCRPRLVALANINIHSASSWILNRMEFQGTWKLEARGAYALHDEPWMAFTELRRERAWAIYSNLLESV